MSLHPRMKVWLSDRLRAARSILEAPDSTPSQRSVARAELGIWGEETKSRTVTAHRLGDCS